jgi:hypothetical protein
MVAERVSSFNVMTFFKHIFSRFCQMGQGPRIVDVYLLTVGEELIRHGAILPTG